MIKKIITLLFCCLFLFIRLCGCNGFNDIDFKGIIDIPKDGIISSDIIKSLKEENSVATFVGESNEYQYEWTIFGSDISKITDLNLKVDIIKLNDTSFSVKLLNNKEYIRSAVISIHLNTLWNFQSAILYKDGKAISSVSITGGNVSIVNFSISDIFGEYIVKAEELNLSQETEIISPTTEKSGDIIEKNVTDEYLSKSNTNSGRIYSDGKSTEQDKYKTDPIPKGKPLPVDPENQEIDNTNKYKCTFSIGCTTILDNLYDLNSEKLEILPKSGIVLPKQEVVFSKGESVFDVLQRVCRENSIHMEASWTPIYNSAYIEGIYNIYEFDCGTLSGWMYRVNGWYPNYGCSRYQLADGDIVEWRYTCNLGQDVGCDWLANE